MLQSEFDEAHVLQGTAKAAAEYDPLNCFPDITATSIDESPDLTLLLKQKLSKQKGYKTPKKSSKKKKKHNKQKRCGAVYDQIATLHRIHSHKTSSRIGGFASFFGTLGEI